MKPDIQSIALVMTAASTFRKDRTHPVRMSIRERIMKNVYDDRSAVFADLPADL